MNDRENKYTLFCNFYFAAAKFGLLDVLHTEVTAALSVDLGFVPGGGFIIGAVSVGRSYEMENTKGHLSWKIIYEIYTYILFFGDGFLESESLCICAQMCMVHMQLQKNI